MVRGGEINVLVRGGSRGKLEELSERWARDAGQLGADTKIVPVVGDIAQPMLGLSDEDRDRLRGNVTHFFHLAAIYDMTADAERNEKLNIGGTRNAVALANALQATTFHHVSSIAAAGTYKGLFREDMFDEGQKLDHPYHRTKFESEKIARDGGPGRVAGVPPGDRRRPLRDRRDGQDRRALLLLQGDPAVAPLPAGVGAAVGPELGYTNIVPVDYVAAAMDHIAHQPGLDGQAFHLTEPQVAALGRRDEHLRPRRPRSQAGHPHRQAAAGHAAQGGPERCCMQLPALKECAARCCTTSGSPTTSSSTWG